MSQVLSLVRVRALTLACGVAIAAGPASAQFGAEQIVTSVGMQLTDVHAADLDGDGDLDVLATHENDPPITWHRNLGGGVFSGAIALHSPDPFFFRSSESVRSIDYDLDGDLDLVADLTKYHPSLGESTNLEVYKNAGNATFTNAASYPFIFSSLAGLAVADLEGDGDDDIFYGAWADSVFVLESTHGALPLFPALLTEEVFAPVQILPTDLDGDGDSDLVVTSWQGNSVTWFENPGRLPFGPEQVISSAANGAGAVSAGDLDGDADIDVIAGGSSSGVPHLRWYENQGGGSFVAHPITIGSTYPNSVEAADLDGDGDLDLLLGEFHGVSWYANDGQGQFGPRQPIGDPTLHVRAAHAADIDGDSVPDVLAGASPSFDAHIAWFPSLLTEPWTNLLSGLAGLLGTPSLVGAGTLEIGSSGSLVLSAAKPSAFGMLFTSLASTPAPFKGGTLVPVPVLLSFPVATNPAGQLPLAWNGWPSGLSGASLYLQYAIVDAAAPAGVSLSNALRADVP